MNGQFSPLGALVLVALLALGGFAVVTFFRQPQPSIWHWLSLLVGIAMLGIGAMFVILAGWGLLTMRRS